MVIVRLLGGLGNQMFQYAAARRLALAHNVPLKLDTPWLAPGADRAYGLQALNIQEAFATRGGVGELRGPATRGIPRVLFRLRRRFKIGYDWTWIHERTLSPADPRVFHAGARTYLDGYWQSEKYFSDVADTIRREFTSRDRLDAGPREILDRMATAESVSVHVRRGDYASHPRASRARSVCTPSYYQRCVAYIAERLGHTHLFVFSDDPDWVAANLRFEYPTTLVSTVPARPDHTDLRLMSACRHHVIANSSFSWWGAWLNPHHDQLVLAPRRWMNDPPVDDRAVVPARWISVNPA